MACHLRPARKPKLFNQIVCFEIIFPAISHNNIPSHFKVQNVSRPSFLDSRRLHLQSQSYTPSPRPIHSSKYFFFRYSLFLIDWARISRYSKILPNLLNKSPIHCTITCMCKLCPHFTVKFQSPRFTVKSQCPRLTVCIDTSDIHKCIIGPRLHCKMHI